MADKPVIPAYPERGWGQMLPAYFQDGLRIENHAQNGRSSKSFRDERRWKTVLERLKPGDFVIVQFGHNDEKYQDPARWSGPFGSFKSNLVAYVREARARQAVPILATPVARRAFTPDGTVTNTHGDYPAAVRQAAEEEKVPLLDLSAKTEALLAAMGPEGSKRLFSYAAKGEYARRPDGLADNTHFCAFGASRVCDLAVEEIQAKVPALARWLKTGPPPDPVPPAPTRSPALNGGSRE
jgi:lysophospholipase L1-like esterase